MTNGEKGYYALVRLRGDLSSIKTPPPDPSELIPFGETRRRLKVDRSSAEYGEGVNVDSLR